MSEKCYYPDWEGNIIGDFHIFNKDGVCIICGKDFDPRTPAEREQDDLAKEWSQMTEQLRNGG
jgi:hypothetical protein